MFLRNFRKISGDCLRGEEKALSLYGIILSEVLTAQGVAAPFLFQSVTFCHHLRSLCTNKPIKRLFFGVSPMAVVYKLNKKAPQAVTGCDANIIKQDDAQKYALFTHFATPAGEYALSAHTHAQMKEKASP